MRIGTIPNLGEFKELIDIQAENYRNGYANRYMVCYIGCGNLGAEENKFISTDRLTDYMCDNMAHTVVDLETGEAIFSKASGQARLRATGAVVKPGQIYGPVVSS